MNLEEIQHCIAEYPLDKLLGKGDFGRTYSIQGNDRIAMKLVLLQSRKAMTEFENETRIQQVLGEQNVAPKIHKVWTCKVGRKLYGFIVMDRLMYVYRDLYPDQTLEELDDDEKRGKSPPVLPPVDVQHAFIGCLEKSIELGYVHNDNHGGNMGIGVDGHVKLFDYGFTHRMTEECEQCNRNQILAFALYQVIEHLPLPLRNDSIYYDVIYLIRQGKYKFGQNIRAFHSYSMRAESGAASGAASPKGTASRTRKRTRRTRGGGRTRKGRKMKTKR